MILRLLTFLGVLLLGSMPVFARTVIRDTEIEAYLHQLSDPLFRAARLDPDQVHLYLLADPALNAFVAGGQNLFLYTGLIRRTENPLQLAGVIAHEAGHIAGGHLARIASAGERAGIEAILGALLGAAAAVAGAPQLGAAVAAGGQGFARHELLRFTRQQEEAADQAAITYLERAKLSPRGMLSFLRVLETRARALSSGNYEFLQTHPLTRNRIRFLEDRVNRSPLRDAPIPAELMKQHLRVVAKLDGFLGDPEEVLRHRTGTDFPDRYARAIALYRAHRPDEAFALLRTLLREHREDPYLFELAGQFHFEQGELAKAERFYRDAVRFKPDAPLLRMALARSLLEQEDPGKLPEARSLLVEAVRLEPRNAMAQQLLGVAEGRLGQLGASYLAFAEAAVLRHDRRDALAYLERARHHVRQGTPEWIRIEDLERVAKELKPPRRRR